MAWHVASFVRGVLRGVGRVSFLAPNPLLMYRFRTSAHGLMYDIERVGQDMRAAMLLALDEGEDPPPFHEERP